jgi:hypothetical protein
MTHKQLIEAASQHRTEKREAKAQEADLRRRSQRVELEAALGWDTKLLGPRTTDADHSRDAEFEAIKTAERNRMLTLLAEAG